MMRSWEARGDCAVSDEALYAHYLFHTGIVHPARDAVIRSQSTDWGELGVHLSGPPPEGKLLWFQKHMAHHLLPGLDRDWMRTALHCFLIRAPAAVVSSYVRARPDVVHEGSSGEVEVNLAPEEFGFHQQLDVLEWAEKELKSKLPNVRVRSCFEF